ncbi:MAG: LPS-assembly protein LptD [Ignavibacteriae bacterium]|nr:LPS-assembly protein LptD [Ignavibacteriota bacterium]
MSCVEGWLETELLTLTPTSPLPNLGEGTERRGFSTGSIRIAVLLILLNWSSFSQQVAKKDTLALLSDTTQIDTTTAARDTTTVTGVDTVVTYSCVDSIVYSMPTRTMSLFSKGDVKYQRMELQAERIDVNWNTSVLTAFGVPDTADTAAKKFRGTPIMNDAGEEYRGHELSYNFQTKKGKISLGDTEMDQGYYHGEQIKKVEKDVLFVAAGRYTTCDAPEPHYYFASPKMKVTLQDKVVAEPVYLYIADVPIFALPFGVFPNKGGRRSGIISPAYGEDARRGRFLSHLGYYWAMNDYMDINFRTDLYTKGGWAAYSDYRYSLRYHFSGAISGEYKRFHEGEKSDPRRIDDESYRVNIFHNQEIDPTTRVNVNFTFASNNSYINTNNLNQALTQSIFSNATVSKSWEGTPNSITLNVSRRQNLINGNIDETLPSISFNHSQSYPLRFGKAASETSELSWYENIGFSYGANFSNSRSKIKRTISGIQMNIGGVDTTVSVDEFERDRNRALSQHVSLNIAPKLGYISISPSLGYSDQRTFTDNDVPVRDTSNNLLVFTNVKDSRKTGILESGISTSTRLYGIVHPAILGIAALRHTFEPRLSFSYSKQIIGEDPSGRQMFMSLNVSNVFEMKTGTPEEGREAKKIQLLNVGAGISYNFSLDSLNFSPMSLSYRTGIGRLLDIGGGAEFDLYKLVQVGPISYVKVNKFLLSEEGRLARLTRFSINLSTSLSGEKKEGTKRSPVVDTLLEKQQASGVYGLFSEEEPDFSIPWRLSLSFDYSENKVPPFRSRSANVRGHLDFNLTENWKFAVGGGYDITNDEIVVPNIDVSRDLHCWIMNFSWVPLGTYRHYRFEIRVKAPQLQDLKVTKQGSERGIY